MIKKTKWIFSTICATAGFSAIVSFPLSSCASSQQKDSRDKTDDSNVLKVEIPTIEVGQSFAIKVSLLEGKTVDGENTIITIGGQTLSFADGDFTIEEQVGGNENVTIIVKAEKVTSTDVTVKVVSKDKGPEPIKIEKVTLNKTSVSIPIGSTETLSATVLPAEAPQTVTWESSDDSVATVEDGVITPIQVGSAVITARSTEDTEKFAFCDVTITPIPVEKVEINKTSLSLYVARTEHLYSRILPSAALQDVTWSSDDTSCAQVDQHGVVTALKVGNAYIRATSVQDHEKYATCFVKVIYVAPQEVVLNMTKLTLIIGHSETISAKVRPAGAIQDVIWSSDNPDCAYVDENGTIHAKASGIAHIKAASIEDSSKFAICTVTVKDNSILM